MYIITASYLPGDSKIAIPVVTSRHDGQNKYNSLILFCLISCYLLPAQNPIDLRFNIAFDDLLSKNKKKCFYPYHGLSLLSKACAIAETHGIVLYPLAE